MLVTIQFPCLISMDPKTLFNLMVDLETIESRGSDDGYLNFVALTIEAYGESIFRTVPITEPVSFLQGNFVKLFNFTTEITRLINYYKFYPPQIITLVERRKIYQTKSVDISSCRLL